MSATSGAAANPVFTTTAPKAAVVDAEHIARRHYGLEVRARMLTSERDSNFQLSTEDGRQFVLKVANAAELPAVTEFQNRALQHIAEEAPDLCVPRVVPTLSGEHEFVHAFAGVPHLVRILIYLPGEPLHKVESSPKQRRQLGRYLARLGQALKSFTHPAADHEILWDLKYSARLAELTVHIADDERREMARQLLDNFITRVQPVQSNLRTQVVHNDFNPHNVLVDEADHERIAGVLDFGDMVRTPLINDVAIACSYQMPRTGPVLSHAAEFVAAYNEVCPLLPEEVDVLFDLIGMRHAMTVTITEWRASRYPENREYILRNNPRACRGMEQFLETSRHEARDLFRRACGLE